jgi:hypothetical protein
MPPVVGFDPALRVGPIRQQAVVLRLGKPQSSWCPAAAPGTSRHPSREEQSRGNNHQDADDDRGEHPDGLPVRLPRDTAANGYQELS